MSPATCALDAIVCSAISLVTLRYVWQRIGTDEAMI